MTETEIRRVLRELCMDLDRTARRVILPAALGAGMALSAGCGNRAIPAADGGGIEDQQSTQPPPVSRDLSGPPSADRGVPPPAPMYGPAWHEDARAPDREPWSFPAYGVPMPDAK